MIEQYFRAGIRLLWNKPNDAMGPMSGAIVDSSVGAAAGHPMTYDGLDGHRAAIDPLFLTTDVSQILGIAKGTNIPYDWLDYAPGRIARFTVGGADILSGYMSGCLIARGTYNGAMSAFHLGTIDNNPDVNKKVKQTFAQALPEDATGFDPAAAWSAGEIAAMAARLGGDAGAPAILTLITQAGAFHSILLIPVQEGIGTWQNAAGRKFWCVGGVKTVPAINRVRLMASLLE